MSSIVGKGEWLYLKNNNFSMYLNIVLRFRIEYAWHMILFCLIIYGIIQIYKSKEVRRIKQEDDLYRKRIERDGEKITLPFDKLKITGTKSSRSRPVTNNWRAQAYNSMFNPGNSEYYEVSEHLNITCSYKGKKFKSDTISMDRKALEIKLYMQKEIHIYYNKATGRYFFDLNFLET